jgi:predicted esterase
VFEALRPELRTVVPSPHQNQSPRIPVEGDFEEIPEINRSLSWRIGVFGTNGNSDAIKHIVVVLHDHDGDHSSVKPLVRNHLAHPEIAFLCLGGINRLRPVHGGQTGGLDWADEPNGHTYHRAVQLVLEQVIGKVLIDKCNFAPRNIALLGHGQGGSVALTIASVWETTRFGGVITIDSALPGYIPNPEAPRNPTPVLMVGGELGVTTPQAEHKVKQLFLYVDVNLHPEVETLSLAQLVTSDNYSEEIKTLQDFLAHCLREEEWETQTVLTFGKLIEIWVSP